jgi:hypothetical protein
LVDAGVVGDDWSKSQQEQQESLVETETTGVGTFNDGYQGVKDGRQEQ